MTDQLKKKENGMHNVDKTGVDTMESSDTGNDAVTTDLSRQYVSTVMKYVEACPIMLDGHVALLARKIDELLRTVKDNKDENVQMQINVANNTLQHLLEQHRLLKNCYNFTKPYDMKAPDSDNQTKIDPVETNIHTVTSYIDPHVAEQEGTRNSDDNDTIKGIISKGPLATDDNDITITINNHTKPEINDVVIIDGTSDIEVAVPRDAAISSLQLPVPDTQKPVVKQDQGVSFAISDINQYIPQKLPLDLSQFKQKDQEMFRSCKRRFEQLIEKHKLGPVTEVLSIYQFIKSLNSVMIQRKIHSILRSHYGAQDLDANHIRVPDSWKKFNQVLLPYEDSIEDGFKQMYLQQKLTDEQKQTEAISLHPQVQNKEIVDYQTTIVEFTDPFVSRAYQSITSMPQYNHLSFEELRLQDYHHKKKIYNFRDDFTSTPAEDFDGTWHTYHSLSAMSNKKLRRTSFEELRVRQYHQMRKRAKKFALSTFEPTFIQETNVETDYRAFSSITAMAEYQHLSVEEIRLQDYRERRGLPPAVSYKETSPDTPSSTIPNTNSNTHFGTVFGKASPFDTPSSTVPDTNSNTYISTAFGKASPLATPSSTVPDTNSNTHFGTAFDKGSPLATPSSTVPDTNSNTHFGTVFGKTSSLATPSSTIPVAKSKARFGTVFGKASPFATPSSTVPDTNSNTYISTAFGKATSLATPSSTVPDTNSNTHFGTAFDKGSPLATPSSTVPDTNTNTHFDTVFGTTSPLAAPSFGLNSSSATKKELPPFASPKPSTTATTTFGLRPLQFGQTSTLNSSYKPFAFMPQYDASNWTIPKSSTPTSSSTSGRFFASDSPPASFFPKSSSSSWLNSDSPSAGTVANQTSPASLTTKPLTISASSEPLVTTDTNHKPDDTVSINDLTNNASAKPK